MLTEQLTHSAELSKVTQRGRGAVGVHVVDVFGVHAARAQGGFHGAAAAVAVFGRGSDVVRVTGHAVAPHLGEDIGAARAGVLEFFEDDDTGAGTHDEAIAALVPRAGCGRRVIVVAGRKRARGAEASDPDFDNAVLGAACDHHVGVAQSDHPRAVADGVGAGGAGGGVGMIGPAEAVFHRNMARGQVDQNRRDRKRRQPPGALGQHGFHRVGEALDTADAGANHDPGAVLRFFVGWHPARHLHRFGGGGEGVDGDGVDAATLFVRHHRFGIKGEGVVRLGAAKQRHFPADGRRQMGRVKAFDGGNPALRIQEPTPDILNARSQR